MIKVDIKQYMAMLSSFTECATFLSISNNVRQNVSTLKTY